MNRWIKAANNLLRDIRKKIAVLTDWIKKAKAELNNPQPPNIADLLKLIYRPERRGLEPPTPELGISNILLNHSII